MITGHYNDKIPVSRHLAFAASGLALCSLAAATASAQPAESVIVDVGACVNIADEEQRLECYESRVTEMTRVREFERSRGAGEAASTESESSARADAATSRPQPSPSPAPETRAAAQPASEPPAEEDMSRAERRAQRRAERLRRDAEEAAALAAAQAAAPYEITGTVTAVRELEPNMLLITLDNGQVWRQNRAQRYRLQVGAAVQLRASPWGPSYRLTDPNIGGFIQVERRR